MAEKYGFIYIWFDCKHKRYYLGRHWGTIDDGYICSSNNMRHNYKNRQLDFKRRIVSYIYTSKEDLVIEEQRWLNMMKREELNSRYYNKTNKASTPSHLGCKHSLETIEKIRKANTGKIRSESDKQKIRESSLKQFSDPAQRKKTSEATKKLWQDPEYRTKLVAAHSGKKQSTETIKKRNSKFTNKGRIAITNGIIEKKILPNEIIPNGFIRGGLPKKTKLLIL